MKKRFTILLVFVSVMGWGQLPPCFLVTGGNPAGDEPPGCLICGPYFGSNETYTAFAPNDLDFPCGEIENNLFLTIKSSLFGQIDFSLLVNCQNDSGVEFALFDWDMNRISDCNLTSSIDTIRVKFENLEIHTPYVLMVDGIDSSICDIILYPPPPGFPDPTTPIKATPDTKWLCQGAEACYSIERDLKSNGYQWEVSSNATILSGGSLSDTFMCVRFEELGHDTIWVTSIEDCFTGFPRVYLVEITPLLSPNPLPIYFDSTDFPVEIDGNIFNDFGIYPITYSTKKFGCDSVVHYSIIPRNTPEVYHSFDICWGECQPFKDSCYSTDTPVWHNEDTLFFVNLNYLDTLKVINLECFQRQNDSVSVSWSTFFGTVDGYEIEINNEIVDTVFNSIYRFLPTTAINNIKVTPFGNFQCGYKSENTICELDVPTSSYSIFHESGLKIHPNPTNGQVLIESKSLIENVTVFDISGRKILATNQPNVSLEAQPAGVYFLRIEMNETAVVKRIIKN